MRTSRRTILTGTTLLTTAAMLGDMDAMAQSDVAAASGAALDPAETELGALATDAYVYGYSLVSVEMSRRVITNVEKPAATRAPMGQFANLREYPTAAFRDVTAPNADTLYSDAFVDLSDGPWVLSWPDMGNRYYVWNIYSAWVPVIDDPGSRTTGQGAQAYAITPPGWQGSLPDGVREIRSTTALVWILGRTYSSGTPEDYRAVWALQDQYELVPLSSFGKPYTPPPGKVDPSFDIKGSVRAAVNALDAGAYFSLMAELMKTNPPAPEDGRMLLKLEKLGLMPGQSFDAGKSDPAIAAALERGRTAGWERIVAYTKQAGTPVNGWMVNPGNYGFGTDYLARAFLCAFGIPANRPRDAVYPFAELDQDGQPLDGANNYIIRFASREDLPPAHGFWSLTMYNAEWFFVANPLNRYTLSERNQLKTNPDGSIELLIQRESPGPDRESNWLPAPQGHFILCLRLYWPVEPPKPSILNLTWKPPAIMRAA